MNQQLGHDTTGTPHQPPPRSRGRGQPPRQRLELGPATYPVTTSLSPDNAARTLACAASNTELGGTANCAKTAAARGRRIHLSVIAEYVKSRIEVA
ncbi:hypothetical protein [Streptomyces sp. NPDC002133]|uniref:hypothetical protein n=1 Tax=Streptomyces sp. NPDC002133 TaxID=3154409 RepID=UPI003327E749